jgi:hypothetical protein
VLAGVPKGQKIATDRYLEHLLPPAGKIGSDAHLMAMPCGLFRQAFDIVIFFSTVLCTTAEAPRGTHTKSKILAATVS